MLNTYTIYLRNYNNNTERSITVKAPTLEGANKLAKIKTTKDEYIIHSKKADYTGCSDYDNRKHCQNIAENLEEYYNGDVRKCPNCGEEHTREWDYVGDVFKCPECEEVTNTDEWGQLSLWDCLNDVYDIEYRIGSDKELRSVQLMVACGGPNIYIDTASKQVELYWWGDRANYPIDSDVCDEIDSIFEEYYKC